MYHVFIRNKKEIRVPIESVRLPIEEDALLYILHKSNLDTEQVSDLKTAVIAIHKIC